jgi:hypothetical protein
MTGFTAVIVSLAALALTVEKIVSFLRHALPSEGWPTWVWNVVAMVVGLGFALGWQINLVPSVLGLIPAFKASTALTGTSGQILTGLAIGASAGFAYGILQALEATVHRNQSAVPSGTQN